jgi:hypothetical protein
MDVADSHIVESASGEDIVVTADIPLAALVVAKGVAAIDPRGDLYTESNVRERLSIRDFMRDLRGAGVEVGGPRPFDARSKQAFAATFDRVLTQAMRRWG